MVFDFPLAFITRWLPLVWNLKFLSQSNHRWRGGQGTKRWPSKNTLCERGQASAIGTRQATDRICHIPKLKSELVWILESKVRWKHNLSLLISPNESRLWLQVWQGELGWKEPPVPLNYDRLESIHYFFYYSRNGRRKQRFPALSFLLKIVTQMQEVSGQF